MAQFDWGFAKDILQTAAPYLGTLLGGPLAGTAAAMIARQVLGKPEATHLEIADAIIQAKNDPELLLKFRQLDTEAKVKLEELRAHLQEAEVDLRKAGVLAAAGVAKTEVDDTRSARDMMLALRSHMPLVMSYFAMAAFAGIMVWLIVSGIRKDTDSNTKVLLISGVTLIVRELSGAFGFWLGSSHGSLTKTLLAGAKSGDTAGA